MGAPSMANPADELGALLHEQLDYLLDHANRARHMAASCPRRGRCADCARFAQIRRLLLRAFEPAKRE